MTRHPGIYVLDWSVLSLHITCQNEKLFLDMISPQPTYSLSIFYFIEPHMNPSFHFYSAWVLFDLSGLLDVLPCFYGTWLYNNRMSHITFFLVFFTRSVSWPFDVVTFRCRDRSMSWPFDVVTFRCCDRGGFSKLYRSVSWLSTGWPPPVSWNKIANVSSKKSYVSLY